MKNFRLILLVNLLILVACNVILQVETWGDTYARTYITLGLAIYLFCHIVLLLLIAGIQFARKKRESGKAFLNTAGLILLIGFSACLGQGAIG